MAQLSGYNRRAPGFRTPASKGKYRDFTGVKPAVLKLDLNLKMACKRMLRDLSAQPVYSHNAAVQLVAALTMAFQQAPFLTIRKIA